MRRPDEFAVLVLEKPWWLPSNDERSASARHFIDALARLHEHLTVFYCTFFDTDDIATALSQYLVHTSQPRQILYIAGHGRGDSLAGSHLGAVTTKIRENAPAHAGKLEGVLLSSCFIGAQVQTIKEMLPQSSIVWAFGYTCSVSWLDSTLLELQLLSALSRVPLRDLASETKLLAAFARGLRCFSGAHPLGSDEQDGRTVDVPLAESIRVILQPRGQGKKPVDRTPELRALLGWD